MLGWTEQHIFFCYLQVRFQNESLQLLLNSEDLLDAIPDVNDTYSNNSLVFLLRRSETSVLTVFSNGISLTVSVSFGLLSFVITIPQPFRGNVSGLLGNFNGDSSDDLMYPNGTVLDVNSSDRFIHDLGQSCKY